MIVSFDDTCTYLWHPVHGWTTPLKSRLEAFRFTDDVALLLAHRLQGITLTIDEARDILEQYPKELRQ